jgi:hypothetical protein
MQESREFRVVIANEKPFNPLAEAAQVRVIFYDGRRTVVEF